MPGNSTYLTFVACKTVGLNYPSIRDFQANKILGSLLLPIQASGIGHARIQESDLFRHVATSKIVGQQVPFLKKPLRRMSWRQLAQ